LLIQYFYEGLILMDRSMIDIASGGALMSKTPFATRNLINIYQFGVKGLTSHILYTLQGLKMGISDISSLSKGHLGPSKESLGSGEAIPARSIPSRIGRLYSPAA
ncbi:hypothetical protein CR513_35080, partial [Mucuna pruriens]